MIYLYSYLRRRPAVLGGGPKTRNLGTAGRGRMKNYYRLV